MAAFRRVLSEAVNQITKKVGKNPSTFLRPYLSLLNGTQFHFRQCTSSSSSVRKGVQNLREEKEQSAAAAAECQEKESGDLLSRILRLRSPLRSAVLVIDRWVGEGGEIQQQELRRIIRELYKAGRQKHALEIADWMRNRQEYSFSGGDYAVHIDLITKIRGVDAAEEYFEALPSNGKTCDSYTSLLHSYVSADLIEKAEGLFEIMKSSGLASAVLPYNELMTSYVSKGHLDKVPNLVEELKRNSLVPDIFTYNLWISSCAASMDTVGLRKILDEMGSSPSFHDDWKLYIDMAEIYLTAGHLEDAGNTSVESEKKITWNKYITYDFLVILYTGLNNKNKVAAIWKSLKMTSQKLTSRSYLCILASHIMLGQLKEAGQVINDWRSSDRQDHDFPLTNMLSDALLRLGLTDKAKLLHDILRQKG